MDMLDFVKNSLKKHKLVYNILNKIYNYVFYLSFTGYYLNYLKYVITQKSKDLKALKNAGFRAIKPYKSTFWRYGRDYYKTFRRYYLANKDGKRVFIKLARNDFATENEISMANYLSKYNFPFVPKLIASGNNFYNNYFLLAISYERELSRFKPPDTIKAFKNTCREYRDILTNFEHSSFVHGDVHEGNLMQRKDGRLFLLDFGISSVRGIKNEVDYKVTPGTYFKEYISEGKVYRTYDDAYSYIKMMEHLNIPDKWKESSEYRDIKSRIGKNTFTKEIIENDTAIVTFHMANNHGALLQCYALQEALEMHNHKAEIVNFKDDVIAKNYRLFHFCDENGRFSLKKTASSLVFFKKNAKRYNAFNEFRKNYLHMSKAIDTNNDFYKKLSNIRYWIAGSDQIWNTKITGGLKDIYMLNISEMIGKHISYAASIGGECISQEDLADFSKKLSSLDAISVREKTAKRILENQLSLKNIKVVADPVFLLTAKEWKNRFELNKRILEKKYILVYLFGENREAVKAANELQKKTKLPIVHFNHRNKYYSNAAASAYALGPKEFVNLIYNAEFIITESFHCTAFSLIFQKRFWCIFPNTGNSSRISDLLTMAGLEERMSATAQTIMDRGLTKKIEYKEPEILLMHYREKSLKWLLEECK